MATDDTKKTVGGWRAVQQKQKGSEGAPVETRQQRLLRESQEAAERVKKGLPAKSDDNYKPGDEENNGEFNMRRAKQFLAESSNVQKVQKKFKSKADLCMLKLSILFCGDDDTQAAKNLKIVKVEDKGYGNFEITYTCD
jgi:hypothetical protein